MLVEVLGVLLVICFLFLIIGLSKGEDGVYFLGMSGVLFFILGLVLAWEGLSVIDGKTVASTANATVTNITTTTNTHAYTYAIQSGPEIQILYFAIMLMGIAISYVVATSVIPRGD